jgi:nucleoside-diphosphate-sugar epimerase
MKVFVTGGSGFVGGAILRRLLEDGHEVTAHARSEGAARKVREKGAEKVLVAPLDDERTLSGALAGQDAVVHAAARMEFWGPDELFERENFIPTVALHRAAVKASVGRFVLLSAAAVSSVSQPWERMAPVVDEGTDEGTPTIAYGRVKLATEKALLSAPSEGAEGRTHLVVLRPPYVWGAGMTTLDVVADAAKAGRFAWIDSGRHTMDFVHVENLAHAVALALEGGADAGVYYVTDGRPMPIRDFFTALMATRSVTPGERSVPYAAAAALGAALEAIWNALGRKEGPPLDRWRVTVLGRDRSYDIAKARRELGYEPVVSFEEGLEGMRRSEAREEERVAGRA